VNALSSAYLVDGIRTPIARYRGSLAAVRPDDLAAHVIAALVNRSPDVAKRLDHVIMGATNQAGEDNRNVARMAVLLAGLPYEVPAVTVNRLCGSGLEAVADAAMRVWTCDAEVVIAGGVESMTRAPFAMQKAEEAFDRRPPVAFDTTLGWRFENHKMAARFPLESMGETAENVADKWKIDRLSQDEFALWSHKKAVAAAVRRDFEKEIAPVPLFTKSGERTFLAEDESPRPNATLEALLALPAVFRKGGTVTAGNSSPLNDGASAVLVVSERVVREEKLEPLARVVAFATAGVDPRVMGEGPIAAGTRVLGRAGWSARDLDIVELNEAFASQSIACIRGLSLDPERVNPLSGAIALGHPVGSSGCRILVTLAHTMQRRGLRRGMAALCIGVGQGIAMLLERG
jgi:3-oxoadipyl-CoA thiolase